MTADPVTLAIAIAAAAVALATDLRQGKIYNWLTLPLLATAPLVQLARHGWSGLGSSLLGAAAVVVILIGLALLGGRGLGGGDIKLLVALGALLGWPSSGWLLLYTGLSSLIVALPAMLWRGVLFDSCRNLIVNLLRRRAGERDLTVSAGSRGPKLRFAVCIMFGVLAALLRGALM
jgi:prepilin peptidase CpaA